MIFELDLPARGLRSATLRLDDRVFQSLGGTKIQGVKGLRGIGSETNRDQIDGSQ